MEKETSFVGDVKLRTFWGRWKDSRWEMKPNAIEIYVNNKLKYKFDLKTYQVTASVSFDKSIKVSFIKKRESTNLFINPPTDKHAYWIHVILVSFQYILFIILFKRQLTNNWYQNNNN